jgi:hypothetical protein
MRKTILSVFIAALFLAACSALPKSNAPAPNPQATSNQSQATQNQPTVAVDTQPAPSMTADEVYKAVSAAWAKLDTAGPRHISQTSSEGGKVESNIEADSVPPDFHQVVTMMGNKVAEQYIVGGTIYNYAQGGWTQTAGGNTAINTISNFSQGLADGLTYSDGMVNGIEVINGSPAIVYSYSTTLTGLDASAQYKLWVDQTSGLPVKSENITADGMTIAETITYDKSITFSLPAEAAKAPASQ